MVFLTLPSLVSRAVICQQDWFLLFSLSDPIKRNNTSWNVRIIIHSRKWRSTAPFTFVEFVLGYHPLSSTVFDCSFYVSIGLVDWLVVLCCVCFHYTSFYDMCLWKSDDTPIVMITNMKVAIVAFQEWWVVSNRCVEDGEGGSRERERERERSTA